MRFIDVLSIRSPRYGRALAALLAGPVSREQLDAVAGASNGPALVAQLRQAGLSLPCTRIQATDRDGRRCRLGVYSLSPTDRRKLLSP